MGESDAERQAIAVASVWLFNLLPVSCFVGVLWPLPHPIPASFDALIGDCVRSISRTYRARLTPPAFFINIFSRVRGTLQ